MANKPVLFFSPNSEDCIDVWKLLKEFSVLNTLIKINVDDPDTNIPKHVRINVLPTILIRGQSAIMGKKNIISYFQLNRNNSSNSNNSSNNSTNRGTANNANNPTNPNNPNNANDANNSNGKSLPPLGDREVPFKNQNEAMFLNSNEMGSNWSDNYSFINNDTVQAHSFEILEQNTTIENKNINRNSNKKNRMDQRMEQLMSERNQITAINRT